MEKRWVVKEKGDTAVVKQLAGALGVSVSLANSEIFPLLMKQALSSIQVSIIFMILF
jgi:hypothetical protein